MSLLGWIEPLGGWALAVLVTVVSTYLLLRKRKPHKRAPILTSRALADWRPKPLVEEDVACEEPPLMGRIDENTLNVGALSFLCFDKDDNIKQSALKAVRRYGVGSCGPRGFYGTIDVHLELEERLASFLQVEETCVYSYGFSTIASAIPSYAKKGDIIFADEGVWFAIQKGIEASRSTARYFRHNDMKHLEELLTEAAEKRELNPKRRAFLIAEGIYFNTGEMCPLPQLVKLARRFKLRIILDESLTIGVVGARGRGLTELQGVPREEVDLIVGSLEYSFASTGGFCAGSHFIVEHQRLSGLGYCFSASLPPLLTRAAISGLDVLESRPAVLSELHASSAALHTAINSLKHYRARGHRLSPVKHVYLKREDLTDRLKQTYLRNIAAYCLERGVALAVSAYLRDLELSCPEPSVRLASSRKLDEQAIATLCRLLDEAYEAVGPRPELQPLSAN